MATTSSNPLDQGYLVQIASYNTNLQGERGLPQDLVDWLSPTLHVSQFLAHSERRAADIIAVGFQELLPLHLGLAGLSKSVINTRNALILSQIEAHAPNKERYVLVAQAANVGVALLVYARDEGVGRRVCDVQTQWTGCGPAWMGNKGAVGVRFRVKGVDERDGEVYTFVNAHLTAHAPNLAHRIADYHHIVSTLLFPSASASPSQFTTIYSTSHLFFLGDLNFRLSPPPAHTLNDRPSLETALQSVAGREEAKEFDQLIMARRRGDVFVGLREGEFWKFKCTYKYHLGEVDKYSAKRVPAWTDRIMYTTYADSPDTPDESHIKNLTYTSVPSYTTSDHKPVVALLLLPPPSASHTTSTTPPLLTLPPTFNPLPSASAQLKRYVGRMLDRIVGFVWCLFWLIGAGSAVVGVGNFVLGLAAGWWWRNQGGGEVAV